MTQEFIVELKDVTPDDWPNDRVTDKAGGSSDMPIPLQHHWAYGYAVALYGAQVQQIDVFRGDEKVALALVVSRKLFFTIQFTTLFRGPLWLCDLGDSDKSAVMRAIADRYNKWRWQFLAIMPEMDDSRPSRKLMQQAGRKRVMTGFSTAWVDMRPDAAEMRAALDGKWRNQLKKAEATALQISTAFNKSSHYDWLLEREQEQRSTRRYQATPLGLVPGYAVSVRASEGKASSAAVFSVTAHNRREKVAGALFLVHGNSATYHIGWSGEKGRTMQAQNLVLWTGMMMLKERGVRFLDMGGMNTAEMAGLARFKLGTGARPITLSGAWV